MRRVLLATDFSENAHHAIDYALLLLGDDGLEFILLNTVHFVQNVPEMLISLEDIMQEQSEKGLESSVEHMKGQMPALSIESMSAPGDPSGVIKALADKESFDLVVLGSQGRSALREAFLGSTARSLIHKISKPLLIVPPGYALKVPQRIVFGTDLTQVDNLDKLHPLIHFARKFQAEIIVLNVTGNEDDKQVRGALKKLDFNRHFSDIKYRFEVVHNPNVLDGILSYIEENEVDMLVVLPKQYPKFKGLFHRSLTKRMVYRAEIPLLVF